MPDRLGRSQPDADTDVITRAAAVPALAVIHVDLPGMPGARTGWPGSGTSGSSRSRLWPARRW